MIRLANPGPRSVARPGEIDTLGDALAALERRDYSTAQRLFEALGRKDAADAIKDALAALDRGDYAAAQGLFDALSLKGSAAARAKGSAPPDRKPLQVRGAAAGRVASGSGDRAKQNWAHRRSKLFRLGTTAIASRPGGKDQSARSRGRSCSAQAWRYVRSSAPRLLYGSPLTWTFSGMKNQTIAGLASAADVLKAPLEAITGQASEEESRRDARPPRRAHAGDDPARPDRAGTRGASGQARRAHRSDSSSRVVERLADIESKLDRLEKKAAAPGAENADIAARLDKLEKKVAVAAGPAPGLAEIATRLSRLEKSAAVATPVTAKPLPAAGPKPSTLVARAESSASNEIARPDSPKPLLRDYSIEDV